MDGVGDGSGCEVEVVSRGRKRHSDRGRGLRERKFGRRERSSAQCHLNRPSRRHESLTVQ